jgi:hypothetical protein
MVPIFIGGCSRSGTTLLGAMLGAHSECLCVPESQFKIKAYRSFENDRDGGSMMRVLDKIKKDWRFQLGYEIELKSVPLEKIGSSYSELIKWIVRKYGEKQGKLNPRIWVDHTPSNIRYAATLFELFPESKMIHMVRDGRAIAASVMRLDWGPNTISKASHYWIERLAYGLAAESFWGEKRVMRVKYEKLVKEPEATLKELCRWLDIDYQKEMANAGGFVAPEYASGQFALVGKPPDAERINDWEKSLTPRQIEVFERSTRELLRYLGYTPKYGLKARAITGMESFIWGIKELLMEAINKIRYRARIQRFNMKKRLKNKIR